MEKLKRIRQLVGMFRSQPKLVKNPSERMIEELRQQMDEIDATLIEFKKANLVTVETLTYDEKILGREVEAYETKITNWLKNPNGANTERPANVSLLNEKLSQSELIKEVVDFDVTLIKSMF